MNKLLGYLFFSFFIHSYLFAQDEGEIRYQQIDSVNFKVNFFKKTSYTYDFNKGDVIAITFEESRDEGLHKLQVISPSEFVEPLIEDANDVQKEILEIKETGPYTFRFINRKLALEWPRNRRCRFVIWKVVNVIPLNNFVSFDTVLVSRKRPLLIPQSDTVILPILDQQIYVEPSLNWVTPNRVMFPFTIPKEVYSWAYWIGAGEEATLQYEQWTAALAAKSQGPLYSYIQGDIAKLPVNESGPSVSYIFANYEEQSQFFKSGFNAFTKKGQSPKTNVYADYGIRYHPVDQEQEIYLCLENEDKASGTTITVKIIAAARIAKEDSILTDSLIEISPTPIFEIGEELSPEDIEALLASFQISLTDELDRLESATLNKELSKTDISRFSQLAKTQTLIDDLHKKYGLTNGELLEASPPVIASLPVPSPKETQTATIDSAKVHYVKNEADSIYTFAKTDSLLKETKPTRKQRKQVRQLMEGLHTELDTLNTMLVEATNGRVQNEELNNAEMSSNERQELTLVLGKLQGVLQDSTLGYDQLQTIEPGDLERKFQEVEKVKQELKANWSHLAITEKVIKDLDNFKIELEQLRQEIQSIRD